MAYQPINYGSGDGDRTGDKARVVFAKLNANFAELYSGAGVGTHITNTPGAGTITGFTPTGFGAAVDRLSVAADATNTTLNDLTAGFDGQKVRLRNTGAVGTLTLTNENAGSSAAARFSGIGNVAIPPGDKVDLIYYAGSTNRWTM